MANVLTPQERLDAQVEFEIRDKGVRPVSAATTLNLRTDKFLRVNTSAASVAVTLPAPVATALGNQYCISLIAGSNSVTFAGATINGVNTRTLTTQFSGIWITPSLDLSGYEISGAF